MEIAIETRKRGIRGKAGRERETIKIEILQTRRTMIPVISHQARLKILRRMISIRRNLNSKEKQGIC
jgi:hypothetical protein